VASRSVPIPVSQAQSRVRAYVPIGTLPLGAAVAFFAALLILFGWLHFILSLQSAETNQQIQDSTNLLEGLRRTNATLRDQVARAQSPRLMESQAITAGYQPKQPIHILLPRASSDRARAESAPGTPPPPDTPIADTSEPQVSSIFRAILAEFDTWWQ
jgi:hypothetical protein